ncbi:MAG: hypothetical protein IID39_06355 [Planctomycetes bacterium]|nr:hypothetical protein [Planctomycetota bacterium]
MSELFDRTIPASRQIGRGLGLAVLKSIDEVMSAVASDVAEAPVIVVRVTREEPAG